MQGPIVVGVDGSPASHEALWWALAEARRCDTSLKVVSAWMLPWGLGLGVQFPDSLPADLQRVAEQLVARWCRSWARRPGTSGSSRW